MIRSMFALLFGSVIVSVLSIGFATKPESPAKEGSSFRKEVQQRRFEPAQRPRVSRPSDEFLAWRTSSPKSMPTTRRWWLTDTFGRSSMQVATPASSAAQPIPTVAKAEPIRLPLPKGGVAERQRLPEGLNRKQDTEGSKTGTLESVRNGGSPLPCGDGFTALSPGWGRLTGINNSAGVVLLVGEVDAYEPQEFGPPISIELNVDFQSSARMGVSLVMSNSSTTVAAPMVSSRQRSTTLEGWTRLGGRIDINRTRILFGRGRNPLLDKLPIRFGLLIDRVADPKGIGIDNFEVRVTSKCTPEMRDREAKEKQQEDVGLRNILDKFRGLKIPNDNGEWREELANERFTRSGKPIRTEKCCDDEGVEVKSGEIAAPDYTDPEVPVDAVYVESDQGPIDQLYPGADTSTDAWYDQYPCKKSVGSWVPSEIEVADETLTLPNYEPEHKNIEAETDALREWHRKLEQEAKEEKLEWPTSSIVLPLSPITTRWIPLPYRGPASPIGDNYAFQGMDIVYVHGLRMSHLNDGLIMKKPNALATWTTPPNPTAQSLITANPEYFTTSTTQDGYFARLARTYWLGDFSDNAFITGIVPGTPLNLTPIHNGGLGGIRDGHIFKFLLKSGYRNRFLCVGFNCNDRLTKGVESVLGQIAVAMETGQGVINPSTRNPGTHGFGRNGLVIISHSTGGLLTDVAMTKAKEDAALNAGYIPKYVKAHIAGASVFGGSVHASIALLAGGAGANKAYGLLPYLGNLNFIVAIFGKYVEFDGMQFPNDLGDLAKPIKDTILRDLTIPHANWHYKPLVQRTPVRTLLVQGSHPTELFLAKPFMPGFDDFTTNASSQGAMRNPWWFFWPAGSLTPDPRANFDLGLFGPTIKQKNLLPKIRFGPWTLAVTWGATYAGQPIRALGYYVDQRIDPFICNPLWLLLNVSDGTNAYFWKDYFQSAFVSPYLSPTGMLMEGLPLRFTPWSPYWRAKNHFACYASAADHSEGYHDRGEDIELPLYEKTDGIGSSTSGNSYFQGIEENREESFVVSDKKIYDRYDPEALLADTALPSFMKNLPLLKAKPQVREIIRGLYLKFTCKKNGNVKWEKIQWFYKRKYHLIDGWETMTQYDYVYRDVLR